MRITKKVFYDLAIFMISFGILIGIIFPFFIYLMGVPGELALSSMFFIYCIIAGLIVGLVNIILAKTIVGNQLKILTKRMGAIANRLSSRTMEKEIEEKFLDNLIEINSEDEIGEAAKSYNNLVNTLSNYIKIEIAVKTFNEMLSSNLNLAVLSKQALQQIILHMSASGGAIFVEKSGELELVANESIKNVKTIADSDIAWRAIKTQTRQSIHLTDLIKVDGLLVDFYPQEILVEPILYKELTIGVIIIAGASTFNKDFENSFELFSRSLGLALHNSIMYDQLQKLAATDALTGMFNRRFGLIRLREEYIRSIRTNTPLGIIMFDIDHFKVVNDTYGHQVGDRILANVSKITQTVMREGDVLIRYGGEEFLILLPGASKDDSYKIAERLRHMVQEFAMQKGTQTIKVTISIGVISHPEQEVVDMKDLIKHADKAMYMAKHEGRNCTVVK